MLSLALLVVNAGAVAHAVPKVKVEFYSECL